MSQLQDYQSSSYSGGVWKPWFFALRPNTLGAALAPVLIGTSMAFESGKGHFPAASAALAVALLIQVGTNFSNDYYDFVKGADSEERLGPTRATQAGWITPQTMFRCSILVFTLSALVGCYLVWRGGWPILLIGLFSILSGILYTGGPYPLGYLGLGEVFVLIFFGPVATGGTYYVQALELPGEVLAAGLAPGLLSTALLAVNNLRDVPTDRKVGKRTLAVRFGLRFARLEYSLCLISAICFPVVLVLRRETNWLALVAVLALLPAIPSLRSVLYGAEGIALNKVLALTGKTLLLFSALFSAGWMFG